MSTQWKKCNGIWRKYWIENINKRISTKKMERKCEMKQFFSLCVAVSLHVFIPFRILISFFTSCFVRYICFALCLVDKTHKIDLKKNLGSLFLSSFASARIFMWHCIEPFSTRSSFSTHYFFLPFVEWRFFARNWSLKYSGRNKQHSEFKAN